MMRLLARRVTGLMLALVSAAMPMLWAGLAHASDATAVKGAPSIERLSAGGNDQMQFFLIAPADQEAPEAGYRLLLVLPGGDGSDDFHPFVTNIYRNALPDGFLVAQLVAPQWRDDENRIVWPTEITGDPQAAFTTESFMDAVVGEVKGRHPIDPRHVYALGWSSGGPPVYAALLRAETPLTGAFVAMSVFRPNHLPPLKHANTKRVYILHSPQDFIPAGFAETARDSLAKAGATTRLTTYEGGHGWHGNVFGNIRSGIDWLVEPGPQAPRPKPQAPEPPQDAPSPTGS